MLFSEAIELLVKFAENYALADHQKEAVAKVRKWMETGILPREENRPLVLIVHSNGDLEIRGATASEIQIDDRRAG